MKTYTLVVFALSLLFWTTGAFGAAEPTTSSSSASDALSAGLAEAKSSSRNVFLLYGFPACLPCRAFEEYLASPEVKPVFEKYFVLVKIDIVNMPDGGALQEEYGPPGAPAWALLNPAGTVLANSDDGSGNVGYPSSPRGRTQYVTALRRASPSFSGAEIDVLTAGLGDFAEATDFQETGAASSTESSPITEPSDSMAFQTLSLLNSPDGAQSGGDQTELLGVSMLVSAQQALVGTWTSKDFQLEIYTEGTPPDTKVRLPSGTAKLHLLWNIDSTTANASAFAVTKSSGMTDAFTFQLIDGDLRLQQVVIFTDRSGRPNQIRNRVLKKRQ